MNMNEGFNHVVLYTVEEKKICDDSYFL